MAPTPSCATAFLCEATGLLEDAKSDPTLAKSSKLLPVAHTGEGFYQAVSAIATDAAGWRCLAWLLFSSLFGICLLFLSVGGKGGRCQEPSPGQPCSAEVGDGRASKVGQGRLAMGTASKLGSEPEQPPEFWWQDHTQWGQKPLGRNQPQSSLQEQCISLLMKDFNELFNLLLKWFTGWTYFPDKQVDKIDVLSYSHRQSTSRDWKITALRHRQIQTFLGEKPVIFPSQAPSKITVLQTR